MMKIARKLGLIFVVLVTVVVNGFAARSGAGDSAADWLGQLPVPWQMTPAEIDALLPQFHLQYPDFDDRLKALAIWRVGTPYDIFKLGEEVEPDPDPIFRLDVSDCTGHLLTTLSLSQSDSWAAARENMIRIHYKPVDGGEPTATYKSRWHYTTDRIFSNFSTQDITRELVPATALDSVALTLNRRADGEAFLELDWERPIVAYFIPNSAINAELLARLPAVCGVAFVRPSYFKLGLVIGHEGMIIDRSDLIHASQAAGETQRIPFLEYYFGGDKPAAGGIMIFRFHPLD